MRQSLGLGLGMSVAGASSTGPQPSLAVYKDTTAITTSGSGLRTLVTSWGAFTSVGGAPLLATDPITGGAQTVRTTSADTLIAPAGTASFLGTGPSTVILVMRYRLGIQSNIFPLLDATAGGTKRGYNLRIGDEAPGTAFERTAGVRIWNGSSYVVDTANNQETFGHFIPAKKFVLAVRLTSTSIQIFRDGLFVWQVAPTLSFSYPTADTGALVLGGGAYDIDALEAYNFALTDLQIQAKTTAHGARFGVDLPFILAGDPALASNTNKAAFPFASADINSKIHFSVYNDNDNVTATESNSDYVSTTSAGTAFNAPTTLTSNTNTLRWSDIKTSDVLSDGTSVVQCAFWYDQNNNTQATIKIRRSTDGGLTYGSWSDFNPGGPYTNMAVQSSAVEDPNHAGHLHIATFCQVSGASTKRSIIIMHSTDYGATWPTATAPTQLDGPTQSKDLAEPGLSYRPDGLFIMIRDNTSPGASGMQMSNCAAGDGVAWASMVAGPLAWSPGQQIRTLDDGTELFIGRDTGVNFNASIYSRSSAAAWNTAWSARVIVDPLDSLMYYPAIVRTGVNTTDIGWGRTGSDASKTNVVVYPKFPTYLAKVPPKTPGSVSPSAASLNSFQTQQLAVVGAGDFTASIANNNSGGSVSAAGVYTAGVASGTDVFTYVDGNGYTVGTFTATVTGSAWTPASISSARVFLRADHATNTGDTTNVTAWNDELSNFNFTQSTGANQFVWNLSDGNAKPSVTGAGGTHGMGSSTTNVGSTGLTLSAYLKWTTTAVNFGFWGCGYNVARYLLGSGTAGKVRFVMNTNVNQFIVSSNAATLNDGNYHVITVTWDGSTINLYIDGVLDNSLASVTGTILTGTDHNGVLCQTDGTTFQGFAAHGKAFYGGNAAVSSSDRANLESYFRTL